MIEGGSIGEFNHYVRRGKYIIGKKSHLTKEKMMANDKFDDTFKWCKCFAGIQHTCVSIRQALGILWSNASDGYASNNLTRTVRSIVARDSGKGVGEQSILMSEYGNILNGFEWNGECMVGTKLGGKFTLVNNADKTSATLTLRVMTPAEELILPEGTMWMRINFVVGAVSNRTPNPESGEYDAVNGSADGMTNIVRSEWFNVNDAMTENLILTSSLGDVDMESSVLIKGVGVDFAKKSGEKYKVRGRGLVLYI